MNLNRITVFRLSKKVHASFSIVEIAVIAVFLAALIAGAIFTYP